ncbi:MAG TPA: diacylglycerol kinase family protein, partial [Lachnospiraceae bacterium]|nr:diacylglycerol kinase family protein [Lachnospiraceae bacterium]
EITSGTEPVTIIVLGGDGTINEVLTGIRDYDLVTLGYIPAGSSNDLARDLMLARNPALALQAVLHPKEYTYMDVGVIRYQDDGKNFGVSAGIGYDAAICHEALHSGMKDFLNKLHLGKLTYVGIALKQLAKTKNSGCTVILDDSRKLRLTGFILLHAWYINMKAADLCSARMRIIKTDF